MSVARHIREVIDAKSVLYQLVRQQLILRYRRTLLGYLWTLINPLLMMTITALVFANLFKMELKTFVIFMFAGMVPWNCFSAIVTQSAASFIQNEGLIKKIYLPKLLFPLSVSLSALIDSVLQLIVLFFIMFCIGAEPSGALLFLPVAYLLLLLFSLGIALFISTLTVFLRDLQHVVTIALQALFFLTPIIYDKTAVVGTKLEWLLTINPLTWFVHLFRDPIRYATLPDQSTILTTALLSLVSLVIGFAFFAQQEKKLVFRL